MPGILGVVASEARDALEGRLGQMLQGMGSGANDRVARRLREGCALGKRGSEAKAAFAENNTSVLVLDGEITDEALDPAPDAPESTVAERLLARYREGGAEALGGLRGAYAVAVWDTREKRLTLITDRYGMRCLYYCTAGPLFLFGSRYRAFLEQPEFNPSLSEQALAEFLEVGYCLDNRTLFRDVALVPPASILTYRKGELRIEPYWDLAFGPADDGRGMDEVVEEFAARLQSVVQRQAESGMCIPISGGLDSRTLLGFVGKHCPGLKVKAVTFGAPKSHDVQFGRQIAAVYGYEHTALEVPSDYMETFGREGMARTEGTWSVLNYRMSVLEAYFEREGISTMMSGYLGDALTGGHLWPEITQLPTVDESFNWIYNHLYGVLFRGESLQRILRPAIYQQVKDEPYRAVRRCFDARPELPLLHRCDYVDLIQRQRRHISAQIDLMRPAVKVLTPFTDPELLDFLLAIPLRLRSNQAAYQEMIRRHLPEVARVPRTGSALPLKASWPQEKLIRARMRFYHKILPRLSFGLYRYNDRAPAVRYEEALRTGSRRFALQLIGREELFEDHFNVDAVRRLVDDVLDGRSGASGEVASLMTFALWRQHFTPAASVAETQPV
jgi:asparagine synthetase B (glutamine-hydrolysing)